MFSRNASVSGLQHNANHHQRRKQQTHSEEHFVIDHSSPMHISLSLVSSKFKYCIFARIIYTQKPYCKNFMSADIFAYMALRMGFAVLKQDLISWGSGDEYLP